MIHGGFARLRDETTKAVSGTPADGIDEKRWNEVYLENCGKRLQQGVRPRNCCSNLSVRETEISSHPSSSAE
jgi:hypothetical protein